MVDLIEELKDRGVFEWAESGTPQCLFFIFPVIIFEGRMYAAKYPLTPQNLMETTYVCYSCTYRSLNYKGNFDIDILRKSYVDEFLAKIGKDMNIIKYKLEKEGSIF